MIQKFCHEFSFEKTTKALGTEPKKNPLYSIILIVQFWTQSFQKKTEKEHSDSVQIDKMKEL